MEVTKADLLKLDQGVKDVDVKVTSILQVLRGHELDKNDRGMIGVQNDHEDRLSRLERIADRGKWFLIGLSFPAAWGIADILQSLLK